MFLNVKELQKRFNVTEPTVLQWIKSGELRAVNVGRKANAGKPRWRVSVEVVEAFEKSRANFPMI